MTIWSAPPFQSPGSIRNAASNPHWIQAAERHQLKDNVIGMARSGSDVVIECERLFFKMTPPCFQSEQENERETLRFITDRLSVKTPEVVAFGELDGWPYFWMTRIEGRPLSAVYPTLSHEERLSIASMLGELVSSLHALPPPNDGAAWGAFHQKHKDSAPTRHIKTNLAPHVSGFMARTENSGSGLSLLHTEVLDEHIFVAQENGRWRISSMIDFADSRVGAREYEFPALVEFIFRAEEGLFAEFLRAYGWSHPLTQEACEQFLYWNLLHQFGSLPRMLQAAGEPSPASLEELASRLYQ
jgi:hygromycin-B 7''-O-kinase